ncbi:hypothetical protein [Parafrankia discariae]|uniref:hypothetical protein n=1 Tax=Parafrankia discariae TaxID=365528 RepID=UPI0003A79980|nr:hypothetical protein [Parafrankia discariae]
MTNNPAIHRRPSGDVDIALPHETGEPDTGPADTASLDAVSMTAGPPVGVISVAAAA